ncbi:MULTISPECIES: TadE/TadG family type IV pilus assembly protein [Nocardioides]|uniref:TadE/TadG family type IV pilus assembly protein n=1 Tax=Nocardioides vastitatis TaxID=2568655 RepID=A0ABW0ZJN0_9ACTN|nr:TadE/TadG family type IV pilus assembly protein [Nocardioides sp.]THI99682.1 pilus assembly protein [Nocardioides sp.]
MKRFVLRQRRSDRGSAAVEFALIMPMLMLLIFGIISYGYMLSFRQAISQAAAEGARAAAIASPATIDSDRAADARRAVTEALEGYGVTCQGANEGAGTLTREGVSGEVGSCNVVRTTCDNEACFEVTISYNYGDHPLLPALYTDLVLPDVLTYATEVRIS